MHPPLTFTAGGSVERDGAERIRAMLTYDQFTARITVRGGSVASTSGATNGKTFEQPAELDPWLVKAPDLADWDPDQPPLLANLWETYDVYLNLARTGLWFDINPFWHPMLACYYLRCEPEKKPSPRRRGATMEPREPKRRTVAVPVAAGPATVTAGRLRELCALGEEWRLDLAGGGGGGDGGGGGSEAAPAGTRTRSPPRDVAAERGREKRRLYPPPGRWSAADALDAVAVSLAMIDFDGTTVVVQTQRGLVEPEVDEEAEAAAAAAAASRWSRETGWMGATRSGRRSTTRRRCTAAGMEGTRSRRTMRATISRRSITTRTISSETGSTWSTTTPGPSQSPPRSKKTKKS